MSEKSFAVVSVAVAVICGAFFYPPGAAKTVKATQQRAIVPAAASTPPARVRAHQGPATLTTTPRVDPMYVHIKR